MLSVAAPHKVLFYADSFYGHVGLFDVSSSAINRADLHLVAYSPRPVGVAYDPLMQVCLVSIMLKSTGTIILLWTGCTTNNGV